MDATQVAPTLAQTFAGNAYEALALLITKVTSGIDQASDFLVSQVPDVIHQLLIYNLIHSAALCGVGFIGIGFCPWIAQKIFVKYKVGLPPRGMPFSQGDLAWFLVVGTVVGVIVSLIVFFNNFDWVKIWLAPKIWLIEYSAQLIRSTTGH